jgi:hypothetical protein
VLDGKIHVPGGSTGVDTLVAALQVFDPATGTWTSDPDDALPTGRFGAACAAFAGKIYLFGGTIDGTNFTTDTLIYDPAATPGARWAPAAAMPVATAFGGAVEVGGTIFHSAFRKTGTTNATDVLGYDPLDDEWTAYPSLQVGRGEGALWALGDTLLVGAGGVGTYQRSIEAYDTSAGTGGSWSLVSLANQGRQAPGYATDAERGRLYLVGGYDGSFKATGEVNLVPTDLPWLSASPEAGVVDGEGSIAITLTFDAGELGEGTYSAELVASTESPYGSPSILVAMEVVDAPPSLDSVTPGVGLTTGGLAITLTGGNFFPHAGPTEVLLGGVPCGAVVVVDEETITCTTPAHGAGAVDVEVINPDDRSTTLSGGFTYYLPGSLPLFVDGFESGDAGAWSGGAGLP